MLIYLDIGTKTNFQRDLKKSTFCLNLDIFGDMGKKRFLQTYLKKRNFSKVDDFFKVISN